MAKRLTLSHPTAKKIAQVENLMNELGITLQINCYGKCTITDEQERITVHYKDVEGGEADSFPYHFETKLIIEED